MDLYCIVSFYFFPIDYVELQSFIIFGFLLFLMIHKGQADSSTVQGESNAIGERNNDGIRHPSISSRDDGGLTKPLPKTEEHAGDANSKSESSSSLGGGFQQSTMPKSGNGEGSSGSCQMDAPDGSSSVPLGLGFGGLQPKVGH